MSSQKKKGMNLERKQNLTGWAFLMPATILIAWMSFYPMIQAFILSLQTGMGINLKFNGFANYARPAEAPADGTTDVPDSAPEDSMVDQTPDIAEETVPPEDGLQPQDVAQ